MSGKRRLSSLRSSAHIRSFRLFHRHRLKHTKIASPCILPQKLSGHRFHLSLASCHHSCLKSCDVSCIIPFAYAWIPWIISSSLSLGDITCSSNLLREACFLPSGIGGAVITWTEKSFFTILVTLNTPSVHWTTKPIHFCKAPNGLFRTDSGVKRASSDSSVHLVTWYSQDVSRVQHRHTTWTVEPL